jgi:AsmA protein
MSKLKILGGVLGVMVLLLGAALLAAWLLINPNNYKDKIVAAVKQSTGRDLKLPGDIRLSVIPWVALEVGPASLGNPPGFGEEPFVSFTHAALRVRLLPLLRRRLEVIRIDIDGLDLRLRTNAQGDGNWRDANPEALPNASAGSRSNGAVQSFGAPAQLRIHSGRVSYRDLSLENLHLETGSIAHGVIPVSMAFDVHRGASGVQISVNARFDVTDDGAPPLRFAAVNASGTWTRPGEDRPAAWELSAPALSWDLSQQTLKAAAFTLNFSSMHLSGSVSADHVFDDLHMNGSVSLMPLVLHEFLPRLGVELPNTKDPKALSQLSGSADVEFAPNVFGFKNLHARLDDTQFRGSLSVTTGDTPALKFDLAADQIDADRYRFVRNSAAVQESKAAAQAARQTSPLEASGTLAVPSAHFLGMDFTNLHLTLASKEHVTHLFPAEAEIDGGRYSGDITLDDRGAVRVVSLDEHLTGIDLTRLLANSPQKHRLSGRAALNVKGVARGATVEAQLKTLNGNLEADLAQGALEGIDLAYQVNRARALFDRGVASQEDTKRTPFDVFKTSAQISNGVAETRDLTISSQALRVAGKGSANLSTKAIDFQLTASIQKSPTTTLVDIPLSVTGTYTDPAVKANVEAVAKSELKQKLQDILKKNGLQGLFGK